MKGYDEINTILLPPRQPGDKLPQELLDYYDEQMKKLEEQERLRKLAEEEEAAKRAALAAEEAERQAAEEAVAAEERAAAEAAGEEAVTGEDGGQAGGDAAIQVPVPVSATSHGSHAETGRVGSAGANNVGVRGSSQSPPQGEAHLKNDSTEKPPEIVEDGKPITHFITEHFLERETCIEVFLFCRKAGGCGNNQFGWSWRARDHSSLSRHCPPSWNRSLAGRKGCAQPSWYCHHCARRTTFW